MKGLEISISPSGSLLIYKLTSLKCTWTERKGDLQNINGRENYI